MRKLLIAAALALGTVTSQAQQLDKETAETVCKAGMRIAYIAFEQRLMGIPYRVTLQDVLEQLNPKNKAEREFAKIYVTKAYEVPYVPQYGMLAKAMSLSVINDECRKQYGLPVKEGLF